MSGGLSVVVYGGSFNPFAINHFDIVRWLANRDEFDVVMVVPSAAHALKDDLVPYVHRLNMTQLGVRDAKYAVPSVPRQTMIIASDVEMQMLTEQSSPIHTIDLLRRIRRGPIGSRASRIRFAIGEDIRDELPKWHEVEAIEREFGFFDVPVLSIRATSIRQMINDEVETWRRHVPRSVARYIELQGLYVPRAPLQTQP